MSAQPSASTVTTKALVRDDAVIVVRNATWADYERMLEVRGEKAIPRLRFCEGALELLGPKTTDEPKRPDLAIEVIWTSGGVDKQLQSLVRQGSSTSVNRAYRQSLSGK